MYSSIFSDWGEKLCFDEKPPAFRRSALDPIGRSPFLPAWNLHKVELFSAFISHLDDVSIQAGNQMFMKGQVSLIWRKKKLMRKTVEFEPGHDPDGPVYYANHSTTEDLLDGGEII